MRRRFSWAANGKSKTAVRRSGRVEEDNDTHLWRHDDGGRGAAARGGREGRGGEEHLFLKPYNSFSFISVTRLKTFFIRSCCDALNCVCCHESHSNMLVSTCSFKAFVSVWSPSLTHFLPFPLLIWQEGQNYSHVHKAPNSCTSILPDPACGVFRLPCGWRL